MRISINLTVVATVVLAALACLAAPKLAHAAEFCVACTEPDVTYLCRIDSEAAALGGTAGQVYCITELAKGGGHGACSVRRQKEAICDGAVRTLPPPATPAQLPFAAEIREPDAPAKDDTSVAPPVATVVPVDAPQTVHEPDEDYFADPDGPARATASPDDEPQDFQADIEPDAKPPGPPRTVEEGVTQAGKAVGDTAKAAGSAVAGAAKKTGDQIGKAGSAVGSAAKKTWTCVTSLFSEC